MSKTHLFFSVCVICIGGMLVADDVKETVGKRPYEMVNAGRVQEMRSALVDFENIDGWTVEATASEAAFERSREQQIWGDYVAKLTYKAVADKNKQINENKQDDNKQQANENKPPLIVLKPPKPIAIGEAFDCVNLWVYGNNWAWVTDVSTPRVQIDLRLIGETGQTIKIHLDTVRWKEWFLIHRKFSGDQLKQLGKTPQFDGFEIRNGTNKEPRTLYFDNLSFYKEELKPLQYEPRPQRGIALPENQTVGTNNGEGKLPFPNREETILPDNLTTDFKNTVAQNEKTYELKYQGKDGELVWKYEPKTGTFADLSFVWKAENHPPREFHFQSGGVRFINESNDKTAKLISVSHENKIVTAKWQLSENEIEYRFQIKQKSLLADIKCLGGNVSETTFGEIIGAKNPRLVTVPYLVGNGGARPSILVEGDDVTKPLFILPIVDHTRSNASELFFGNNVNENVVNFNSGSRYKTKTDGKRNDCFERLFFNVSPIFEEVLPNIPNNPSPYRNVTAERVWRSHHSSNHENDFQYWNRIRRYGVEKMLITDHEVMWRDGGESFTFRTYAAPGRGGDEGHKEYTKKIHGLGYIYGPYNNYTDYAPVNEFWNEDWVTRLSDGNFQPAWARCYNPKPSRAVEVEPKITDVIQKKFGFNTAYCDVHTAVTPWNYVDYDARVPGAGTFAATYYAYGEILLHQKKIWNGPVYSEGNNHWYYSGLADGNYAQDQSYQIPLNAWLVDFDLRKIHPLENNFGMGNPGMFRNPEKDAKKALDRFLAATLAFGHTGFLTMEYGLSGGIRSYFTIQQIAKRYGTQKIKRISYCDKNKKNYLTTSQAVAADKVKLNRIKIEYEDGLVIHVNGSNTTAWNNIPPNGWNVQDSKNELIAWSLEREGKRTDYVDSPDYLFAEVRDNPSGTPIRFHRLLCDKQLIVIKHADEQGRWEMIVGEPNYEMRSTIHAVQLDNSADADAVALDFHRKEIGKAETRYSRGMVHVMPVEGAFSYLLTPKKQTEKFDEIQVQAIPGEDISIDFNGKRTMTSIPLDTKTGTLYWYQEKESGKWLDFEIIPLCEVKAELNTKKKSLDFSIRSNLDEERLFNICLKQGKRENTQGINLPSRKWQDISFPIDIPTEPQIIPLELIVPLAEAAATPLELTENHKMQFTQKYQLTAAMGFPELEKLPEHFETGYCQRNKKPSKIDDKSGAVAAFVNDLECGDKTQAGWMIHPPYQGGVGYTFLLSDSITIPDAEGIVLSSEVGIRNGGDKSDGVLYQIYVLEDGKADVLAGEILQTERGWSLFQCDLSAWKGKTVRLRLAADVGRNNDSTADWAAWANIKLVSTKETLLIKLETVKE